jgi:outer membrane receptor for ferrienterochelin and colicins
MKKIFIFLVGALCAMTSINAVAQDVTEYPDSSFYANYEDHVLLNAIVVSANRSETTRRMAPTLVNVLPMQTYERVNASTVSQGLNFQPGVRVESNCQNCGFQQVRINGLDGPYTQILIDSRPIFSALAGVYGIEQIPANMVDRVEVMRGGGSALFGSSAIAGTINIITKEPDGNSASLAHTTTNVNGSSTFENNTTLNASLISDNNKLGLAIFAQSKSNNGHDANGDGFTELMKLNSQTLGTRAYFKPSAYTRLTGEYHHLQEFRRGGDQLHLPPHEVMIAEQVRHSIDAGSLRFDWFSRNERHRLNVFGSVQHIGRESYYGAGMDPNAYGETDDLTWVAGAQYVYKAPKCLFMPADFTAGIEYNQDDMVDNMWGYGRVTAQKVNIASAYLQNEWKNDMFGFLIGGRLDSHNLINGLIFSPRANVRYNPIENINLRASYSFGFRAPQAFDEDLHIDNVGGIVSMIQLAKDLKVEKSQSFSLSADMYQNWGSWQGNILVEGFYTNLSDVFALKELGVINGILVKERINESGARVYGANLEGKVAWMNRWQFQAGMTLQRAEYKEARQWSDTVAEEKRMFRTPNLYGYFTTIYNPTKQFSVALSGTYTGSMLVEHHAGYIAENRTELTPDFFDMGIKLAYDFKFYETIGFQINAGVQNIFNSYQRDFDSGSERDSGYVYGPALPRCFYLGVKLSY